MLLVEMLVDMGHEVCGVERTAAGAVVAALSQRPDLMLVDAHLGAESGVAAVAQILRSRKVAYVLVSGGTIQSSKAEAVLLKKPFTSAELASALSRALALHRRDDVT
jgi:CheY-like chemotaxis protein